MRWDGQTLESEQPDTLPGMAKLSHPVRTVSTPKFAGMRCREVLAKSALNRVLASSAMPFSWTINTHRGCSHACIFCFARNTHTYLDLDAGKDLDREIIVKTNAADVWVGSLPGPAGITSP